jgi:hypothetical protein
VALIFASRNRMLRSSWPIYRLTQITRSFLPNHSKSPNCISALRTLVVCGLILTCLFNRKPEVLKGILEMNFRKPSNPKIKITVHTQFLYIVVVNQRLDGTQKTFIRLRRIRVFWVPSSLWFIASISAALDSFKSLNSVSSWSYLCFSVQFGCLGLF